MRRLICVCVVLIVGQALRAQTPLKTQAWHAVAGQIAVPTSSPSGTPVTVTMQAPGVDLTGAHITWETLGREPAFGQTFGALAEHWLE